MVNVIFNLYVKIFLKINDKSLGTSLTLNHFDISQTKTNLGKNNITINLFG
jgi:hypothetical protein